MENSKSLVVLLVICSYVASTFGESCMQKFGTSTKMGEIQSACIKSLKLNETDMTLLRSSDLKETHFDDKCISNCTLEGLKAYHNGTFNKEAILEQLKTVVPEADHEKLSKAVDTCVEKATQKPGGHKNKSKNNGNDKMTKNIKVHDGHKGKCSCKRAAKFVHCMMENDITTC
ncbi:unnamed protein product [Orchesella dallaii]|uniref:Uncharacterized protein n=1 Tax=Orchesella dallaii TaxID=48710 RepID=A0ABP1Q2F9_9HEXA